MRYEERPPGSRLRSLVDRFWALETLDSDLPMPSPVLPDGHVEVMVHIGVPFAEVGADGCEHSQAGVLLGAQMTEAARLVTRPGALVVGARLRPYAAALLTGVPQHQLTGRIHDLSVVDRSLAVKLSRHLAGRQDVLDAMNAFEIVLSAAFAARLDTDVPRPTPALMNAVTVATRSHGLIRVEQLAEVARVTPRQLERQFAVHVGLSPKRFLRVLRFQHVIGALRVPSPSNWPDLAVQHGFYDQAHFINDFRSFTGETPGAWEIDEASLTAVFAGRRDTDER
jgi:AraC-like DNA-binding protein